MSEWSDKEIEDMGRAEFQGRPIRCPRCSGPVDARRKGGIGRPTEDVILRCKRCGTDGKYSTAHLAAMKLTWTHSEKVKIVEQYWAHQYAYCPKDSARLLIIESRAISRGPQKFFVRCLNCGRNFSSSELDSAVDPESFEGWYEEVKKLAEGGMGSVTLVKELRTGQIYAAKRILPQYLRDPESVQRFEREKRILQKLSHNRIVPVKDVFMDENGGVIVMEYMSGGSLVEAINGPTSSDELCDLFDGVVEGLKYLHGEGVIHRDLKPANILVDQQRNARISDFGLARLVERDSTALTQVGRFVGTPLYAAPEQQVDSSDVSKAADIYALGLIAYEIATRKSPFLAPVMTHKVKPKFADSLSRALEQNPADRTISAEELASQLRAHFRG
jgi:serine/threonine protein kinase